VSYTRVYRKGNWILSVPEKLISQDEIGNYYVTILGKKQGPFVTEEKMTVWLLNNRSQTVQNGVMTEYRTPGQYSAVVSESQEDIAKIMQALVASAISFQYVPPDVEGLLVYTILIKKEDRKPAEHAISLMFG
jgi:hypothetical protein